MVNVSLAIIQFFSIGLLILFEYARRSLSIFIWGTLFIMFAIPHLLGVLIGNTGYSEEVLQQASLFVIMFNVVYLVTKIVLQGPTMNRKLSWFRIPENKVAKTNQRAQKIHFCLLVLTFIILLYYSYKYLGGILAGSFGAFLKLRSQIGRNSILSHSFTIFFATSGVSLGYIETGRRNMGLLCITIVILYSLLRGNRMSFLPAIVTIIIHYIYFKKKKFTSIQIVGLAIIAFLSLYSIYMLRLFRFGGGVYAVIRSGYSLREMSMQAFNMILNGEGELGLRRAFYHFIHYDNNFINFNKGHTYIRFLLIGVPRMLIPSIKPPDFAIDMGTAWSMNPYNTSYSMHPTLYGDCFANFWWFGIILGSLWAVLVFVIDAFVLRFETTAREILMVLLATSYVIIARGSVYNGLFTAFAGTLIVVIVDKISRLSLNIKRNV